MTKDEAREILIAYKKWRHGGKQADSIWSNEIKSTEHFFEAIDCAIQALGDGSIRNTLIDYTDQLKAYTHESMTILGHDDRESSEFVDIFLSTNKPKQP